MLNVTGLQGLRLELEAGPSEHDNETVGPRKAENFLPREAGIIFSIGI
jgi:hypothetical protein